MNKIMRELLVSALLLAQATPGSLGLLSIQTVSAEDREVSTGAAGDLLAHDSPRVRNGGKLLNTKFIEEEIAEQTRVFSADWDAAPTNKRGTKWAGHSVRWYVDDNNVIHVGDGVWDKKANTDFRSTSSTTKYTVQIDVATTGTDFTLAFSATKGLNDMRSFMIVDIVNLDYIDFTNAVILDGIFEYTDANLEKYDFSSLVSPSVISMDSAFFNNLTPTLDTSNWNTENVTNFRRVFGQNNPSTKGSLTSIDTTNINTKNATNLSGMFMNDSLLDSESIVGIANWDVSKNTDFSNMFKYVRQNLPIESWNVQEGTTFESMLEATSVPALDLTSWNMSKAKNIDRMFAQNVTMTSLNVSNWDVQNVTTSREVFADMRALPEVDVSGWNLLKTTTTAGMFRDMLKLSSVQVGSWTLPAVTDTSSMFANDTLLVNPDVSHFSMNKVITTASMFKGTKAITTLDTSGWNLSLTENFADMFNGSNINSLDVSNWNPVKAKSMNNMFMETQQLTDIDLSTWSTPTLDTASTMFKGSSVRSVNMANLGAKPTQFMGVFERSKVEKVDLSGIDFTRTTAINNLFSEAKNLTDINVDLTNLPEVRQAKKLFYMVGTTAGKFNTPDTVKVNTITAPKVNAIDSIFEGSALKLNMDINWEMPLLSTATNAFKNAKLSGLHISKLNAPNLTSTVSMFEGNPDTTGDLGLENGPTFEKVTDMSSMFANIGNTEINLSNFHPNSATNMSNLFAGFKGKELNLETFNNAATTNTNGFLQNSAVENVYFPATFKAGSSASNLLPAGPWRNKDKPGQTSTGTDFGSLWSADRAGWWTTEMSIRLLSATPTIEAQVRYGGEEQAEVDLTAESAGENEVNLLAKLETSDTDKLNIKIGGVNLSGNASTVRQLSFADGTTSQKVAMNISGNTKTSKPGDILTGKITWTITPVTK